MANALVRVVVACALSAWLGAALAISYTVQVIAVSDQASALSISRELLRDGFPAYVVRSTGAQGDVFRVRVGAFANRGAALRYAETMPEVAGARPVPALAEAIPQGIMPLAPRLLLQQPWDTQDVRLSPWPAGGVAVRVQSLDPLRQALYVVFQDGVERRFEAWAVVPLAVLPEPPQPPELDVPFVDLTVAPDDEPAAEPTPAPAERADERGDDADAEGAAGPRAAEAVAADDDAGADLVAWLADPLQDDGEAGLLLLRDRWLWPPSWTDDDDAVRTSFRASLIAITSRELGLTDDAVDALAYAPGGTLPPALVVLDLSDPSARDAGWVVGLGDPSAGLSPEGPEALVSAPIEAMPAWPEERVEREATAAGRTLGGSEWTVSADDGFVRITLVDGATWRAGVGTPLWSDGRFVAAWDGEMLLLYDFVAR